MEVDENYLDQNEKENSETENSETEKNETEKEETAKKGRKFRSKCILNAELKKQYPFLENVPNKTKSDVRCTVCSSEFSIGNAGKTDIDKHIVTKKHQKGETDKLGCQPVKNFFKRIDTTLAAREGLWAYHIIKSNISFLSTDCSSKLFRECFAINNFRSARTKTEAIVTNVLAPIAEDMLNADLKSCRFVTLTTDASNHGSLKLMPVMVRYFLPTVGVKVKMLEFTSIPNETSETVAGLIKGTAEKNNIVEKVAGFCGDNCPTNFGSVERGGENNVYHRLKQWRPAIYGIGCGAHASHNTMKFACSQLPVNIEYIVVKIFTHFYIYTVRVEALKSICELEEIEYAQLLGYAKTRFLALGPAIGRILQIYDPLKIYFMQLKDCPEKIKTFFESPLSKLILLFVKDQVKSLFLKIFDL